MDLDRELSVLAIVARGGFFRPLRDLARLQATSPTTDRAGPKSAPSQVRSSIPA